MFEIKSSRSITLNVVPPETLKIGCAYNIKLDENYLGVFTKSVDNSKPNFLLYTSPRPEMLVIVLRPAIVLDPTLKVYIEEFQARTKLIIHGVL